MGAAVRSGRNFGPPAGKWLVIGVAAAVFASGKMVDGERKRNLKCHFLPNLHSDPTLLNAHVGACKGLKWNEVKGQRPFLVLSENSEVVVGGGALGACRGASSVTKVSIRVCTTWLHDLQLMRELTDIILYN